MHVVLAGASGFLGKRLAAHLAGAGHRLTRLVRRQAVDPQEVRWAPDRGELPADALVAADAVINLAGAGVGDHRWTAHYKAVLHESRIDTTRTIAAALAALPAPARPATWLNGSAVGWYGDTGDTAVDETYPAGTGFLADLCRDWEAATAPAEATGVRVVRLRTGLPLDAGGGLLKPQLLPFRLGLGGTFGSGRQWIPWLSLPDWLAAVSLLLVRTDIAGPVNVVGPEPATNREFTRELARALHRRAPWRIPGPALRLLLGEFAVEALRSARVVPGVLAEAGFRFQQPRLGDALRRAVGDGGGGH